MSIFNISNGEDHDKATSKAVNYFLSLAKNPGLDVEHGIDTYTLAQDYCSIIKNIIELLSRLPLPRLQDIPHLTISPSITWSFLSHRDETGTIHRWKFVDHLPNDISSELHSWEVFGDIAAADSPMVL